MRSALSRAEAYAALGLSGPENQAATTAAFRLAVKAARPDHPGGDDARFRRVIHCDTGTQGFRTDPGTAQRSVTVGKRRRRGNPLSISRHFLS